MLDWLTLALTDVSVKKFGLKTASLNLLMPVQRPELYQKRECNVASEINFRQILREGEGSAIIFQIILQEV